MGDPISEAKTLLKPAIGPKDFRVFVFGPGLKLDEVLDKPAVAADTHEKVVEHARFLRFATRLALEKLNFTVDYGESPDVQEFWDKTFLTPDPGSIEIHHAERMCGAIVIFPSSIGSMCELGLFAARPWVCQKTIAIAHQAYEKEESFFRRGLLEIFEQEGGKHVFLDYANHQACVDAACKFVRGSYNSILRAMVTYEQSGHRLRGRISA